MALSSNLFVMSVGGASQISAVHQGEGATRQRQARVLIAGSTATTKQQSATHTPIYEDIYLIYL